MSKQRIKEKSSFLEKHKSFIFLVILSIVNFLIVVVCDILNAFIKLLTDIPQGNESKNKK